MPDIFRDFTPEELQQQGLAFLEASKKKMPDHFKPSKQMAEGYQYLSGEIEDTSKLQYGAYCNELYDMWKGWAPKFCSRPPNYIVRPSDAAYQPLADACQELFRYRIQRFNYQQMILQVCQDAVILGVGYFRHEWDKGRGLTVTKRFKPQNVFWEATAKTPESAKHVIEKHSMTRCAFAARFGMEIARDVPAATEADGDPGYFPVGVKAWEQYGEKSPLDTIEYYLLWSCHEGYRRCYAFHEFWKDDYLQPASRDANENVGEPWPFDFDEGEWHLTPLIPTVLNDRLEGIAMWNVIRGPYIAYQNLRGASVHDGLIKCKAAVVYPDTIAPQMRTIEAAGATLVTVGFPKEIFEDFPGRGIDDLIKVVQFGQVSPDLLRMVEQHKEDVQQLGGANAVGQIQPGGVETAAEATKLADAAANRVADDQGAVERTVNKVGRKEQTGDLMKMPALSVLEWTMKDEDEGRDEEYADGDYEEEGEKEPPHYLRKVPADDAILLEKGPASDQAALRMEAVQEKARNQAWVRGTMGDPQFQGMQPDQAAEQVPTTPEVAVRAKYGVPVLAKVEISSPGVDLFIPAENAQAWPQRAMTRREVERMFQVSIEQGTSSSTGRMQAVQEILMVAKLSLPIYQELGLDKQMAAMLNAAIARAELQVLDDCKVSEEEIAQARQMQQQAAQQQAMAEQQAKAPTGDNPEIVKMQTDAEQAKAAASSKASDTKVITQQLKNEGDAIRERTQNAAQLQMGAINRLNGVA